MHFACFHYSKKGFTLIELLVVIAILGALVAVAIPAIAPFIGRGDTEAKQTELDNVMVAVTVAMVVAEEDDAEFVDYPSAVVLDPSLKTKYDPAYYLYNATKYKYQIDSDGTTTPDYS